MSVLRYLLLATGCVATTVSQAVSVDVVLPPVPVHDADDNGFVSPLAWDGKRLFSASVVPPPGKENGINLHTLVRQGEPLPNGKWRWDSFILDKGTLHDKWHNSPSVGLDRKGYLHVAYNMHNMPWQYSVSQRPGSIEGFLFRGQRISDAQRRIVQFDVRYPFDDFGSAAIPGNQVTYPVFFNAPDGRLYVTWRYAMRPKRGWLGRSLAGGLAVYDEGARQWRQLGGDVSITPKDADLPKGKDVAITRPIVYEEGWTLAPIQVAFDNQGGMHLTWLWRQGTPGKDFVQPSYAYSPDGGNTFYRSDGRRYKLPIGRAEAEKLITDQRRLHLGLARLTVAPDGNIAVMLHPLDANRMIVERRNKRWTKPVLLPYAPQQLHYDDRGRLWAFASGLHLFRRDGYDKPWQHLVKGGQGLCHPKALPVDDGYFVFMRDCKAPKISILKVSPDG